MRNKDILPIVNFINILVKKGALNPDEHKALLKAVRDLGHAISIKDFGQIEKAIDKISKLLLEAGANLP